MSACEVGQMPHSQRNFDILCFALTQANYLSNNLLKLQLKTIHFNYLDSWRRKWRIVTNCAPCKNSRRLKSIKKTMGTKYTFWHDKCGDASCGNGRTHGIAPLVDVDASVPSSPCLRWSKHATTSAHIAKSTLTWAMGATSSDTGNTSYSATCSPRLSRSLMTWQEKKSGIACKHTWYSQWLHAMHNGHCVKYTYQWCHLSLFVTQNGHRTVSDGTIK